MKILYTILSYKRPIALSECIRSLFSNTKIRPDLCYILDDNSGYEHQQQLLNFSKEYSSKICPINLIFNSENLGVGHQIETCFNLAKQHSPDLFFLVEGDYFWRGEFFEDILDVFEKCPFTWGTPGMHHNDMLLEKKYYGEFCELMKIYYGKDIDARFSYYKNFYISGSRGDIECNPNTNTCGCQILHWKRINEGIKDLGMENEFWQNIYKGFQENGNRKLASDGRISCTITWYFELWAKKNNIDMTKNFSYVTPLPGISFHAANGGLNGQLDPNVFPEGDSFPGVNSGTFPKDYNNWKRNNQLRNSSI